MEDPLGKVEGMRKEEASRILLGEWGGEEVSQGGSSRMGCRIQRGRCPQAEVREGFVKGTQSFALALGGCIAMHEISKQCGGREAESIPEYGVGADTQKQKSSRHWHGSAG